MISRHQHNGTAPFAQFTGAAVTGAQFTEPPVTGAATVLGSGS